MTEGIEARDIQRELPHFSTNRRKELPISVTDNENDVRDVCKKLLHSVDITEVFEIRDVSKELTFSCMSNVANRE